MDFNQAFAKIQQLKQAAIHVHGNIYSKHNDQYEWLQTEFAEYNDKSRHFANVPL